MLMSKRDSAKDGHEGVAHTYGRKVILSRKGFDSSAGGKASPVFFEDTHDLAGTLLSLPIPDGDARDSYADLEYDGMGYDQVVSSLKAKNKTAKCHVDPDIREGARREQPRDWKPAFGQTGKAQKQLCNAGVMKGDLFLFFGWFRGVMRTKDGALRYMSKGRDFRRSENSDDWYRFSDLQVIWGYMEVGDILTDPEEIRQYYWHPHAQPGKLDGDNNTLYIPTPTIEFRSRASWLRYPGFCPRPRADKGGYDEKRVDSLPLPHARARERQSEERLPPQDGAERGGRAHVRGTVAGTCLLRIRWPSRLGQITDLRAVGSAPQVTFYVNASLLFLHRYAPPGPSARAKRAGAPLSRGSCRMHPQPACEP